MVPDVSLSVFVGLVSAVIPGISWVALQRGPDTVADGRINEKEIRRADVSAGP